MQLNKKINITNECNMDLMARYPDDHFDLAVVDPEYGIGASKQSKKPNTVKQSNGALIKIKQSNYLQKDWDDKPAGVEYFKELKRVSKNQIIWGANYYEFNLKGGRIVWDKMNGENDQFGCEIAYISLNNRTDIIRYMWTGMMQGKSISKLINKANIQQGNKKLNEKRYHPTQKPVKLYEWVFKNYAKEGDKILDTHLGSGSIAIALNNVNELEKMNLTLDACELDKDYYKDSIKRIKHNLTEPSLFAQVE